MDRPTAVVFAEDNPMDDVQNNAEAMELTLASLSEYAVAVEFDSNYSAGGSAP